MPFGHAVESRGLAGRVLPLLVKGSDSSAVREVVLGLALRLDADTLLDMRLLEPYRAQYGEEIRRQLSLLKGDSDRAWQAARWIRFAGLFQTPAFTDLVRAAQDQPAVEMKYAAVTTLLRHGQKADPAAMKAVASDPYWRIDLFRYLKRLDKVSLFPAAWASRRALAESELYNVAMNDFDEVTTTYLGERTVLFGGAKRTFLLFRIQAGEEGTYLGVAGPYPVAGAALLIDLEATGIHWDEEWSKGREEELLRNYLANLEKGDED